MQFVVKGMAIVMQKVMGVSGAESVCAAVLATTAVRYGWRHAGQGHPGYARNRLCGAAAL